MPSAEVKQLLSVLSDRNRDWPDISKAISRLEVVATTADLPKLRRAIESDRDFYLGEVVGPMVGNVEGVTALPFLLRILRRGQERGFDHDGLAFHITELVEMHAAESLPVLTEMSQSGEVATRRDAAWLWGFVAGVAPLEPLLALSRDPDPRVVGTALGSLGGYKGNDVVFQRLSEALADADERTRIDAISTLGYYGDRCAVLLLRPLAKDKSDDVCRAAKEALRQLR